MALEKNETGCNCSASPKNKNRQRSARKPLKIQGESPTKQAWSLKRVCFFPISFWIPLEKPNGLSYRRTACFRAGCIWTFGLTVRTDRRLIHFGSVRGSPSGMCWQTSTSLTKNATKGLVAARVAIAGLILPAQNCCMRRRGSGLPTSRLVWGLFTQASLYFPYHPGKRKLSAQKVMRDASDHLFGSKNGEPC